MIYNYFLRFFILLFLLSFSNSIFAENKSDFIMEHVSDSHTWHFFTVNDLHFTLPLPVIIYDLDTGFNFFSSSRFYDAHHKKISYNSYKLNKHDKIISLDNDKILYDFSITKNVLAMLISVVILFFIIFRFIKNYSFNSVPMGFRSFLDQLICFVKDDIAKPNIGSSYEKFMPYLLTVFFFIWLNNLLGLIPGFANVTGNISVTLVLASFTFFITNFNGSKYYWGHIFNPPGIPLWILPIMLPIEVLGLFIKPFALTVRLFANMTAGHIILLTIISLIFVFESCWLSAVSIPFGTFMFLLKLLVAFLQAYVFTLLSAIYFGKAVESH